MSTFQMFTTLLNSGEVTPTIQKEAYLYAVKKSNIPLLTQLARYRYLLPELETELGQREELDVLTAWAARSNRTQDEIVERFTNEKRATLLQGLAGQADLPAAVYDQLVKRNAVTLNWQLLTNESVQHGTRMYVARILGKSTTQQNRGLETKISPLRKVDDDIFGAFCDNLTNPYAINTLARALTTEASPQRMLAVARNGLRLAVDGDTSSLRGVASVLDREDLSDEVYQWMKAEVEPRIQEFIDASAYCYEARQLRDGFARIEKRRTTDLQALKDKIRSSPTHADLMKNIVDYYEIRRELALPWDRAEAAEYVFANAHVDEQLVREYAYYVTKDQMKAVVDRAIEKRNLGLANSAFAWGSRTGVDIFSSCYEESEDPEALLEWLLGDQPNAPDYMVSANVLRKDKELSLRVLPVATTAASGGYAKRMQEILEESFGDNRVKWEMFAGLLDEWTGSFTRLVATVNSLTDN